jgi:hypothetical protein
MKTIKTASRSTMATQRHAPRAPMNGATGVSEHSKIRPDAVFFRKGPAIFLGSVVLAGFLAIGSSGIAQPAVLPVTQAISPITTSTQVQEPVETLTGTNQALMSQMINEFNQRQFQLTVAGTQGSFPIAPSAEGERLMPILSLEHGGIHFKR